MKTKRVVWVVAGMLGCVGFGAAPARGTILVYEFEGVVDSVVDFGQILTQFVQIGDTISGTVTVDRSLPDLFPDVDYGSRYEGAVIALDGQAGDLTFTLHTPATSVVEIRNDAPPLDSSFPGPWDRYAQGSHLWIPEISEVMSFGLDLMDFSGTAFDATLGDAIPTVMPGLDAFLEQPGNGHGFIMDGGGSIQGDFTSLASVPEPGSVLVFLLGIILGGRPTRRLHGTLPDH